MGFGIPSFSDIKNAVTSTASSVTNTVTGAASSVRDFGAAALDKTKALASDGVDLGRRAVNAVRSVDVREAASTVRHGISTGIEAARGGIKTGVEWAGQRTHEAADFARDHVPGGDNVVSNAIRGGITVAEDTTRFQLGVVGGVAREVVGLAGTVGELGTTAVEMQLSPEASREYGEKILHAGESAVSATGNYLSSVAHDPSRIGGDLSNAAGAVKDWGGGQIDRYEQAFKDGKGFETVGMDVGAVATYVVPVGGGPLRGALTAGARGATEAAVRGGVETAVRGGTEAVARGGAETVVRSGGETTLRGVDQAAGTAAKVERAGAAPEAGSIRRVNPQYPAAGHTQNCVQCVIATEKRWAGDLSAVAAATKGPLPISEIPKALGGAFQDVSGASEIGAILSRSGEGARGIVYGADHARGFGHVWNVRIDKGVVRFLDSQPGAKAGLGVGNFDHFTDFKFLLTHAGK